MGTRHQLAIKMVVNDANLDLIVNSLRALNATHREKLILSENLLSAFKKIQLDSDGNIPIDKDTDQTMTQARRDEIYDKCISTANEFLGIDSD